MFADKLDLLTVMNSIIQENSSKEKQRSPDFVLLKKATECDELKRLDERIEKLEELNDNLLCIVHFLFEKIFGLTKDFFHPVPNQSEKSNCEVCETATDKVTRNCYGSAEKPKPSLTKRETDIFHLLAQGLCAKEIAKVLFISETTVITHKKNLKEKFKAKNTVELISNVLTNGNR